MNTDLFVVLENRVIAPGIMRLSVQLTKPDGSPVESPFSDKLRLHGEAGPAAGAPYHLDTTVWVPAPVDPGQFYMLKTLAPEPLLARPISVHEASGEVLVFMYQVKGTGTQSLAALDTGDALRVTGPCGRGFPLTELHGRILLASGGIGIAPFRYLARLLWKAGHDRLTLAAGFRSEPFGVEDYRPFVRDIRVATEDGSTGVKGRVPDLFDPRDFDTVIACGPVPMLQAVQAACAATGTRAMLSLEARMACGIGACLGCTIRTTEGMKRVCADGPVFPAEEVIFDAR